MLLTNVSPKVVQEDIRKFYSQTDIKTIALANGSAVVVFVDEKSLKKGIAKSKKDTTGIHWSVLSFTAAEDLKRILEIMQTYVLNKFLFF